MSIRVGNQKFPIEFELEFLTASVPDLTALLGALKRALTLTEFRQKKNMNHRVILGFSLAAFLLLLWSPQFLLGQDDDEKKVKRIPLRLKVVDPDGEPIVGANVRAYALRSDAEPGSHFAWRSQLGEAPTGESNTDGVIETDYPEFVIEDNPTSVMTWEFTHPSYVTKRLGTRVEEELAIITLDRGYRIAATAIDGESREKISEDLFAFQTDVPTDKWKLKNGFLTSPTFGESQIALRLVHFPKNGPMKFTDLIKVEIEDKSRIVMRNCELKSGVRVEGKLDDSVPRPIKNGVVNACIVTRPDGGNRDNQWIWFERAEIKEDGTFVFESLPQGDVLQMTPVCDGWVPANPTDAESYFGEDGNVNSSVSNPQMVRLKGDMVKPTLQMVKTAKITMKVLGPNNQPVSDATLYTSPNQRFFNLGTQLLGDGGSNIAYLKSLRDDSEFQRSENARFQVKTDENGVAEYLSLPFHEKVVAVAHKTLKVKEGDEGMANIANRKEGEPIEVTIRMVPKN